MFVFLEDFTFLVIEQKLLDKPEFKAQVKECMLKIFLHTWLDDNSLCNHFLDVEI